MSKGFPRFLQEKNSLVALDLNKDANTAMFGYFRDKNSMHDQVRQINCFPQFFSSEKLSEERTVSNMVNR